MRYLIIFINVFLILAGNAFAEKLPEKANEAVESVVPQALDVQDPNYNLEKEFESKVQAQFDSAQADSSASEPVAAAVSSAPAAQPLSANQAATETTARATADANAKLNESEIPVLSKATVAKSASSNPMTRLLFSVFILASVAIGLVFFSKWYSKKYKKTTDNNKIRILTQHYIGPKKSLAIVRVAGESILIGITDQNISMLKTLSLLDEELPEISNGQFSAALTQADNKTIQTTANAEADDFVMNSVKDKITLKVKNMRTF